MRLQAKKKEEGFLPRLLFDVTDQA
jgi:hypothetical protein